MAQQQLLIQALAAAVVSLTVAAGFEAFDQARRQATQDALGQRAISIGTDIVAAHQKPSRLGGIDLKDEPDDDVISKAAGLNSNGFGADIPAEGAGDSAVCDIDGDTNVALVHCASGSSPSGSPRGLVVTVRVGPGLEENTAKVEHVEISRGVEGKGDIDLP